MAVTADPVQQSLIDRARSGEAAAVELLYREHGPAILALARRLTGSATDAEDVLHDLFLGLPEALTHYEERGNLGAWLRRVAARLALMRMRAARRRREVAIQPTTRLPARGAAAPGDGIALQGALDRLPASLRVVFLLKEVEGYAHAEIARTLGISAGTSKVRLFRAVRRLRALLRNDG